MKANNFFRWPAKGLLFILALLVHPAVAKMLSTTTTATSLVQALNPDGTLRSGTSGSFDARSFRLNFNAEGRPIFTPASHRGEAVYCIAVSGAAVYIGGSFKYIGELKANHIVKWDGNRLSTLGQGFLTNGVDNSVFELAIAGNGDLYASGGFLHAGGMPASHIAKWNGTTWSNCGAGISYGKNTSDRGGYLNFNPIRALAVARTGEVYVAGRFALAGGKPVNNIAKWDGKTWSGLAGGVYDSGFPLVDSDMGLETEGVNALAINTNGDVYVGGFFEKAGTIAASGIAKWDGATWSNVGNSRKRSVSAMTISPAGVVYVADGSSVAWWNGTTWSNISHPAERVAGMNFQRLLSDEKGIIYALGYFGPAVISMRWDGVNWIQIGPGVTDGGQDSSIRAAALATTGELYLGGTFNKVGSVPADCIAKWNGTAWRSLLPRIRISTCFPQNF